MDVDQYRMMMETLVDMSKTLDSIRIGIIILVLNICAFMIVNLFLMSAKDDNND